MIIAKLRARPIRIDELITLGLLPALAIIVPLIMALLL